MLRAPIFVLFSLFLAANASVGAAANSAPPSSVPIFQSTTPLDLKLTAPFEELFSHAEEPEAKSLTRNAVLTYRGKQIKAEIRMRGFSSLNICKFPKLTLKFKKSDVANTDFAGLSKIDIGTHCDAKEGYGKIYFEPMIFNHREALLYRWLQILGIPAYSARSARMTYVDTSVSGKSPIRANAFLLETLSSFTERTSGIEIRAVKDISHPNSKPGKVDFESLYTDFHDHPQIDRQAMARIAFFEALIDNSDYRLAQNNIWNLKLVKLPDGRWLPIPLDFNLSGLARGESVNFLAPNTKFYDILNSELNLETATLYESKREELYRSIDELGVDPKGREVFKEALDVLFAYLTRLKKD